MAEGTTDSKGRKWSWSKTFKSIGRSGKKPTTDSFGPGSPLDLSWDPKSSYSAPIDFAPPHLTQQPSPTTSLHKLSLSFSRSTKHFTPQPDAFSSTPFCPPSPTPSQFEKHLAPRPAHLEPPPWSTSLPSKTGGRKRLGSPRLKSPRTGGPLKPFGRKPDVAALDAVLGLGIQVPSFSPSPPHPSIIPPSPSRPSVETPSDPPSAPLSHLRSPPGRRRLGSPPVHRKPKAFGAKVKDTTSRAVHALTRVVSTISSTGSSRSRANSISNSESGMSSRRIESTSSAATSIPTRSSHASRDSLDDFKLAADEELKKLVAEEKIRSRTISNASSDGWVSESSRATHHSNATRERSSSFSHASFISPPSPPSHHQNPYQTLTFASRVIQPPQSPHRNHFPSKSTSAVHNPLPISSFSSTASLRISGHSPQSSHPQELYGRRPSLPTLLSTIASGNGHESDEDVSEEERDCPPRPARNGSSSRTLLSPSSRLRQYRFSDSDGDDAEAVLAELMINVTSPKEEKVEGDVDLWTSGTVIRDLSPVDSSRSERSRKSTSSDMTSVADLIPLFRSPPTSPPFTPLNSGRFSARDSFSSRVSASTPPTSVIYPASPLSLHSGSAFPLTSSPPHSIFGDFIFQPTSDRRRSNASFAIDPLHSPAPSSTFGPYRPPSPTQDVHRYQTVNPLTRPRRPSSERNLGPQRQRKSSRDLPIFPPPTISPPPIPDSPFLETISPKSTRVHPNPQPSPDETISPPGLNASRSSSPSSPPCSPSRAQSVYLPIEPPSPSGLSPPPTPHSLHSSEVDDGFESAGGFWERRGSTGGDSLLDLYATSRDFYLSPTEKAEEYEFDVGDLGSEGEREEERQEEEEDGDFDLPPRRRTDVVPPRVPTLQFSIGRQEETALPSPAFAFDA